jgi:hypothetical protein
MVKLANADKMLMKSNLNGVIMAAAQVCSKDDCHFFLSFFRMSGNIEISRTPPNMFLVLRSKSAMIRSEMVVDIASPKSDQTADSDLI